MTTSARFRMRTALDNSRHITTRRSNDFGDFDMIECPNTFDDDPQIDEFFHSKEAKFIISQATTMSTNSSKDLSMHHPHHHPQCLPHPKLKSSK